MINQRASLGLLLLLAGIAACKGEDDAARRIAGQTGDEGVRPWTPPGSGDSDSACPLDETAEELGSIDEDTALGFSGADLLAVVSGSRQARVRWNTRPAMPDFLDHALQVSPGGVDEALRLELEHDGSSPRYRARTRPAFDAGAPAYCRGQLELDVTVALRSDSGALDERWWGTLTASDTSQALVLLEAPTWRGRLPSQPDRDEGHFVNAQEGSLDVVDTADPGSQLAWVQVVLRWRASAVDGSVNGWVQDSSGGAFVVPQLSDDNDGAGWIGVIGDGFFRRPGVDD